MPCSLPQGYEVLREPGPPAVMVVVAERERDALISAGIQRPEELPSNLPVAGWIEGGRIRHPVLEAGEERWLLKAYRHGGLFARWNPDRYWGSRRFLRELETAVRAVHAGVPAPEPIALILQSAGWGGAFRVWQVVRYVPGVRTLREFLGDPGAAGGSPAALGAIFRAAGEAVRRMHQAQIDHPDLNVGNILARCARDAGGSPDPSAAEAFIVDWDKARWRAAGSWNPHRNLLRLWRSALKMARRKRPSGVPDPAALRAFLRGYFGRNRRELRALRAYVRPRMALMVLHSVFWDLGRLAGGDRGS